MLKNYLKTMFRSLLKRKVFTLINLSGLSIGMAVCLLLTLYIQHELGWDDFHTNSGQIYRLACDRIYTTRVASRGIIPPAIGQAVQKEFPEVLQSVRLMDISAGGGTNITVGDKLFTDDKTMVADSNFFKVFDAHFITGNIKTVLLNPQSAVINETTAKRLFGSITGAMGKEMIFNNGKHFFIDGVCKDWPEKSHLQFNILLSMTAFTGLNNPDFYDFYTYDYLLLNKNASAKALEVKLPQIVAKYVAPTIPKGFGESYEQFVKEGNGYHYFLQPLPQIHLHSTLVDEMQPGGSLQAVYLFTAIGIFILFLAFINFINLSTALSVDRAREVGIRKTFGSGKASIIWQFLGEAIFFSMVSLFIAALLASLMVPMLSDIAGIKLSFNWFFTAQRMAVIFGFAICTGIIAGLYPAFVLSSFKPILVLKGRFRSGTRGMALRNGLVVFQFAVSVILIVCTLVINNQMHYMLGNKLGFDKDNVVSIDNAQDLRMLNDRSMAFTAEVMKLTGVTDISFCSGLPDGKHESSCAMQVVGTNIQRTQKTVFTDERYQPLLGLTMVQGRFFSKQMPTDTFALVLNEAAVKDFGLTHPIGAKITSTEPFFNSPDGKTIVYTVIGVVKDYHSESLHDKIAPLVIANTGRFFSGTIAVKIKGDHFAASVKGIEDVWKKLEPKHNIQVSFLDQNIALFYKAEQTAERIVTIFSLLAVFIACVGLLGLAMYATLQRTKEIGIRKVLGATTGSIFMILSSDFLKLVIISILLSFPLAWWAMHAWLQGFAYHVNVAWWIFILAGGASLFIALATISYQAIRAALANPVKSLRTE
ncbi:MAG TPA: ABC transporter permease [Chitinophagaceae bacterium]|nr:ABC transporter permease [Chitinophagaceae bacterium]